MFGGEWRGESGGREAKINTPISTNAPSCIAITLLNCTAHIEILILPLVLLAAKADVYVRDLREDQPVRKNPVFVKHGMQITMDGSVCFIFYLSEEPCHQ